MNESVEPASGRVDVTTFASTIYAETVLWASFANHLFESLRSVCCPGDQPSKAQKALFEKLELVKAQKRQLEDRMERSTSPNRSIRPQASPAQRASCHSSCQGSQVASFPLGADHTICSLPAATSRGRLALRLSTSSP
jgi:hypothetical protein